MPGLVVVGAQWGDEGKGKVVHWLASQAHLVVRYQGGNNAGHTVVCGGKKYALHTVPSGILVPKALSLLGNGVIVNPRALREEVEGLERAGVRVRGRLKISPLCHVILPTHLLLDGLREGGGHSIGTTRKGIGPCYEDKTARRGVRVCDYLDPALFRELAGRHLRLRGPELSRLMAPAKARRELFRDYDVLRRFLAPLVADVSLLVDEALAGGRRVLFEGAQGAMLDVDFGTYPFVTSSSACAGGACTGAGVGPTRIGAVLGVAKAYATRVGLGPFPTEIEGRVGRFIRETGGEYGTTTGRPRRVGWLDLVQLKAAARVNGLSRLALMKLDTLSGVHPLRVCTAYRLRGRRVEEWPPSRKDAFEVEPVYESFPGFSGDLSGARRFEDLPRGARDYVRFIERSLGLEAAVVSVGKDREQTVLRRPGVRLWP